MGIYVHTRKVLLDWSSEDVFPPGDCWMSAGFLQRLEAFRVAKRDWTKLISKEVLQSMLYGGIAVYSAVPGAWYRRAVPMTEAIGTRVDDIVAWTTGPLSHARITSEVSDCFDEDAWNTACSCDLVIIGVDSDEQAIHTVRDLLNARFQRRPTIFIGSKNAQAELRQILGMALDSAAVFIYRDKKHVPISVDDEDDELLMSDAEGDGWLH